MAGVTMFSVLDLEEGPGERAPHPHPPPPFLFWVKKKTKLEKENRQAGQAKQYLPLPRWV